MRRWWAIAAALYLLAGSLWAQERHATVKLDGGVTLHGTVVSMDLERLQLRTADGIVDIPSARIQRFAFADEAARPRPVRPAGDPESEPAPAPLGEGAVAGGALPAGSAGEPLAGAASADASPAGANGDAAAGGNSAAPSPTARAAARRTVAATEPLGTELPPEELPYDLRHASRFAERLANLDHRYPWLVPALPVQWFSMSLAVFALLSLIIHGAVKIASGESPEFSRSMRLASCYLVACGVQFAFVPANDFAVAVMLLINPALALFLLCRWFGLGRVASMLSFAIQLGFLTLGVLTLELVDAVLGSINTPGV